MISQIESTPPKQNRKRKEIDASSIAPIQQKNKKAFSPGETVVITKKQKPEQSIQDDFAGPVARNAAAEQLIKEQEESNAELSKLQKNARKEFGGMLAECIDDDFLYKVTQVAGNLLDSASIIINESGLTIQTTDPQSVAVVIVDLPAKMFASYRCEGFTVAHIDAETFVNMLKKTGKENTKFKLTLEIRADDTEIMYVSIFDTKKKTKTTHIVKLWEPKDILIYFDKAQFDNYRVVYSRAWHEEINSLSHLVDQSKPIRITAGNDLVLSIEDEYGESTTEFIQNKTPGYQVIEKYVDVNAKDAEGNYSVFNDIIGLARQNGIDSKQSAGRGRKKAVKKEPKKKKAPASARRRRDDEDEDAEDEEAIKKEDVEVEEVVAEDDDEKDESKEEEDDESDTPNVRKYGQPINENEAEESKLTDPPEKKIDQVKLSLSLLLVKLIAKGLQLNPELVLLIKNNYPMMFLQRVKEHGRFLIALSPQVMDEDGGNDADNNAMDQLMALQE